MSRRGWGRHTPLVESESITSGSGIQTLVCGATVIATSTIGSATFTAGFCRAVGSRPNATTAPRQNARHSVAWGKQLPASTDTGHARVLLAVSGAALGLGALLQPLVAGSSRHRRCLQQRSRLRWTARADTDGGAVATSEADEDEARRGMVLPITRLVGLEDVKLALRLACIDISLGGVGICGRHGTAKTTLARSLRDILPRIEVVKNSICNCDPEKPREWDALTKERLICNAKGEAETKVINCPFVELPLGCTEDRLVGSLDVQASMETGKPIFEPGLLAQAHRGILYIDDVNLLQEDLVSLLLTAIESGVNRVEREGLSVAHPCRPMIVATWNPDEGPLRPHLMDRLAMVVSTDRDSVYSEIAERVSAVTATLDFAESSRAAVEESQEDITSLQTSLLFARELLSDVELTEDQLKRLSEESARGFCEGHRAEVFAAKIARAHAALFGRDRVNADDVQEGVKLAILPRMRVGADRMEEESDDTPPPPPPPPPQTEEESPPDDMDEDQQDEQEEDQQEQEDEQEEESEEMQQELPEEFMISAEGAIVDEDLLKFQNSQKKQGRSGKGSKIYSMDRGRYVKAMLPKGGDSKSGKIALDATLRNAVVYQKIRKEEARKKGTPEEEIRNVYVEKSDIWVKKMARKAGALVIFVVDASGSMALNRMQNAKGAVLRLLESAYQSRDQVALIPCRGIRADVLVPPTASVARASSSMQVLPCGGGTPLSHALSQAMLVGTNAIKSSDVGQVCVVAITDGRANVPLAVSEGDQDAVDENGRMKKVPKEDLEEEMLLLADRLRANGFKFLLIDTENKYVSSGIAKTLTDRAGGRYYYLPRADDKNIAAIASDAIGEMRDR